MLGWAIFRKSVVDVISNFMDVLRVTGTIFLLALTVRFGFDFLVSNNILTNNIVGIVLTILVRLIETISFFWIAVSLHRYLLLGEFRKTIFPKWHGRVVLAYLSKSYLIGLILLTPVVIFSMVIMKTTPSNVLGSPVLFSAIIFGVLFLILRVSTVLPAIAVENSTSIGEAWRATNSCKGTIVLLVVLTLGINALPEYFLALLDIESRITDFALPIIYWIQVVLSISILTTLYGYLFEARSLD